MARPKRTTVQVGRARGTGGRDTLTWAGMSKAGFPTGWTPPLGRVLLTANGGQAVLATLNGPVIERGSEAGWEEIERRRRRNAVDWKGGPLIGWEIPLLIDAFLTGGNVEVACDQLDQMIRSPERGEPPPTVRVFGVAPIGRRSNGERLDWVMVSKEPAEEDKWIWRERRRVRAFYTVTVVEATFADLAKIRPAKRTRDTAGRPKKRTYTVKRGDTLRSIAAKVLGDADRASDIRRLNSLRDGKGIRAGQKLKLP